MQGTLTESEVILIKELAQKLLNGHYFCGSNENDEEVYRLMLMNKFKDPLSSALNMVGYDLVFSEQHKTVYVKKQDGVSGPRTNIDLLTTKIIYMFMKQYLIGVKKFETNKNVFYKWTEFLVDFEPFMKKNLRSQVIDSIWVLKDLGVVNVNTPKKDMKKQDIAESIVIEIYPSINCFCEMTEVQKLEELLCSLVYNKEEGEKENE